MKHIEYVRNQLVLHIPGDHFYLVELAGDCCEIHDKRCNVSFVVSLAPIGPFGWAVKSGNCDLQQARLEPWESAIRRFWDIVINHDKMCRQLCG